MNQIDSSVQSETKILSKRKGDMQLLFYALTLKKMYGSENQLKLQIFM
jgi:hypothetical protein